MASFMPAELQTQCVTTINLTLLPQPIVALNNYPNPLYQMLNVNKSTFLQGILPPLENHDRNNDTNGEHQLGGEDIRLLPLPLWPTNMAWTIVWTSWLLHCILNRVFATSHCTQSCSTIPITHFTHLFVSCADIRKDTAAN